MRVLNLYEGSDAINAEKKLNYFGCKVDHSDSIVMKLNLDVPCHIQGVYKFEIDIAKHMEKVR